jgi:hypothetical protein
MLLETNAFEEPNCRQVVISNVYSDHPNGGVVDPTACFDRKRATKPFATMRPVNLQLLDLGMNAWRNRVFDEPNGREIDWPQPRATKKRWSRARPT